MKKILFVFTLMFVVFTALTSVSIAVSQESTNYLTETFGTAGSYTGPLATSSTNTVYGNWKLRLDVYDTAKSQGTEMTVKCDPEDSTNNVLEMKRTQKYDGTNNLVNLESMIGLSKVFNTNAVAISFRLKHTNGYTLTIEPFLGELCPDSCMLYSNGYASYEYIRPSDASQQELMRAPGWHTYKFIIDYKANQTSLFIDEQLIGQPVQFATTISNLNFVQLRGTEYAQTIYYLDDIKVDGLSDVTSYAADSLYFTDKDGMFVQGPQPGGELNRAVISKSSSQAGNGTAVFACFNENNILQSVKTVNFADSDFNNDKATLNVNMQMPASVTDITNGKTKVFFLKSMSSLKPLEAASEFRHKVSAVPSFYLIGDSTMCTYDERFYPRCGTGQVLSDFFSGINIYNRAASGATTSSMLGNGNQVGYGMWVDVLSDVKTGDYAVLQLGINDSRNGIGLSTYINNIDAMVKTLHEKGVNVILASMITDHIFTNGNYNVVFDQNGKFVSTTKFINPNSGEDYLEGLYSYMESMSGTPGFRSIDMTALTAELIGPNATENGSTRRYFILDCLYNWDAYKNNDAAAVSYNNPYGPDYRPTLHAGDTTHLTVYGASKFAQKMAQAIHDLNIALSGYTTNLSKEIVYPYIDEIVYPKP